MSEKHFLAAVTLAALSALPVQAQTPVPAADQTQSAASQITAPDGFSQATLEQLKSGTDVYSADGTKIGSIVDIRPRGDHADGTGNGSLRAGDAQGHAQDAPDGRSSPNRPAPQGAEVDGATGTDQGSNVTAGSGGGAASASEGAQTSGGLAGDTPSPHASADAALKQNPDHALVDVGDYLGKAGKKVQVPVTQFQIFAKGDELRAYWPIERAQLESLPADTDTDTDTAH